MANTEINPFVKPRIAVIGISLPEYDTMIPGFMDRLKEQLQRFTEAFGDKIEVTCSQLCWSSGQFAVAVTQAETDAADALLIIPMSYVSSLTVTPILEKTKLPVIIWNTQEATEITPEYNFDDLLMNHVPQGTQDVTNVLLRSERIFGMESGNYRDETAINKAVEWLHAAKARTFARQIRVGRLGGSFKGMGDFDYNHAELTKLGPDLVELDLNKFIELIPEFSSPEISEIIASDKEKYDIDPAVDVNTHIMSVRLEIALRRIVEEENLHGFTMNFAKLIEDGGFPTIPFLGINKMLAEGLACAGEGDILTTAYYAELRSLCGAANFTEIYTVDYPNRRMMMTHMQECNPALAKKEPKVKLVKKDFWAPGIEPYVGMHFTLAPGPVTLTCMTTGPDGKFKILAYEAFIVDMLPLKNFDIPHWLVQLEEPVEDFLTRYSLAGGPHHLAAVPGHRTGLIRKLAHLQEMPLVLI